MNFLLSGELQEFREVFRKFLEQNFRADVRRAAIAAFAESPSSARTFAAPLWGKIAELGVFSASIPEAAGGLGLGALARHTVLEESGAAILSLPILESLGLAACYLEMLSPDEGCARLEKIASGELRMTAAFPDDPAESQAACECKKQKDGSYLVSGALEFVSGASVTDAVLFFARVKSSGKSSGLQYLLFELAAAETSAVQIEILPTLDLLRPCARITMNSVSLRPLSEHPLSDTCIQRLRCKVAVCLTAEMVGAADKALQMTIDYVKTRKQFGRSVGSFQAVQHMLADMALKLEQGRALGRFAAWCIDHDESQIATASFAAKGFCSDALPGIVEDAIQCHGGIGFTFEYDLHLYLRRVLMLAQVFLPKNQAFSRLAEDALRSHGH